MYLTHLSWFCPQLISFCKKFLEKNVINQAFISAGEEEESDESVYSPCMINDSSQPSFNFTQSSTIFNIKWFIFILPIILPIGSMVFSLPFWTHKISKLAESDSIPERSHSGIFLFVTVIDFMI